MRGKNNEIGVLVLNMPVCRREKYRGIPMRMRMLLDACGSILQMMVLAQWNMSWGDLNSRTILFLM